MTFNENAIDDLVMHRLAVLRYEAGTTEAMLRAYDRALQEIDAEMVALRERIRSGASVDRRRLDRLISLGNDVQVRIVELRKTLSGTLNDRLGEAAEVEAAFVHGMLERRIGISMTKAPDHAVAVALNTPLGGRMWTDRLSVDLLEMSTEIQDTLAVGLAKGASMDDIAKALGRGTDLIETYRGRLVAIARTEVQRVSNHVALATYAENTDVLRGVQWLATLDSRTCLVCAPLHNRVYLYDPTGKLPPGFRMAPLHPRCRCFCAPVTKDWHEIGVRVPKEKRASLTSTPATDTTFDAWLKRQGEAVQLDVFGSEEKRDAWARGALPLSKFSDAGRVLGLGELRGRYPELFPA